MTAQMMNLLARVDGLPLAAIPAQRVWPVAKPTTPAPTRSTLKRTARQTMVVHHAPLPAWAKGLLAEPVEDLDVHEDLQAAGLL